MFNYNILFIIKTILIINNFLFHKLVSKLIIIIINNFIFVNWSLAGDFCVCNVLWDNNFYIIVIVCMYIWDIIMVSVTTIIVSIINTVKKRKKWKYSQTLSTHFKKKLWTHSKSGYSKKYK